MSQPYSKIKKPTKGPDSNREDKKFVRSTKEALKRIKDGKGKKMASKEFLKELEKWKHPTVYLRGIGTISWLCHPMFYGYLKKLDLLSVKFLGILLSNS